MINLSLIPYKDDMQTDDFIRWFGGDIPSRLIEGRYPTPNELQKALQQIKTVVAEYTIRGDIWRTRIYSLSGLPLLEIEGLYCGSEPDMPCSIHCQGDVDLLKSIIWFLPMHCGTYLVMTEGEEAQLVVSGQPSGV